MNVFDLSAKLTLNSKDYDRSLDKAEKDGKGLGSKLDSVFGGLAKAGLAAAAAGVTALAGASGAAVIALGKQALDAYANYEQLTGGVDKLYGNASKKLQDYASQAWQTSNMSANQYMETATSFSAALVNSLDGDVNKAADMTDVAMRAMSDNVNVFGSDMESVQNAFQGFAKQNYTMLDNLKLGYGGTKEEMQRLIDDANAWGAANGKASDLSIDSFADVVTAIQQIQEAQGIAGTTANEALHTIEGTMNATKSAWQNVISAIGGGGDLQQAMDGLITSVFGDGSEGSGLMAQIIPRIKIIMDGVGKFMEKASPYIEKYLPPLVKDLMDALGPTIKTTINVLLPAIKDVAVTIFNTLKQSFKESFPELAEVFDKLKPVAEILLGIFASAKIIKGITTTVSAIKTVVSVISGFAALFGPSGAITLMAANIGEILIPAIAGLAPVILPIIGIVAGVIAIGVALYKNWDTIKEKAGELGDWISEKWEGLKSATSEKWGAIKETTNQVWSGISQKIEEHGGGIEGIIGTSMESIKTIWSTGFDVVNQLTGGKLGDALSNARAKLDEIKSAVSDRWETIKNNTSDKWKAIKDRVEENGGGIKGIITTYTDAYKSVWQGAFDKINEATGGKLGDAVSTVGSKLGEIGTSFLNLGSSALTWGKDLIENFINGLLAKWEKLKSTVKNIAQSIKDFIGFSEPKKGPLSNFHTYAPDMMDLFMEGINDNKNKLLNTVSDAFDFENLISSPSLVDGTLGGIIKSGENAVSGGNVYNITFNQPMESPIDVARTIREEAQYGLLGG